MVPRDSSIKPALLTVVFCGLKMPPRLNAIASSSVFDFSCMLQSLSNASRNQSFSKCSACLFSTSPAQQKTRKPGRRVDPYRAAQARQRKSANLARKDVLQRERQDAMGDPVRSNPSPFLDSLFSRQNLDPGSSSQSLNYNLDPQLYDKALERSKWLTEPLPPENEEILDPAREEQRKIHHEDMDTNARRAVSTIVALDNGSSFDRTRVNIQKCIEAFGRHNTDKDLPQKPQSSASRTLVEEQTDERTVILNPSGELQGVPGRAGPDTGSSEVQAAILTAKINVLADNLYKKDKHNKRNLRLLVHKRQKHLNYLRRKERGGPRWQNLIEKLGISDAMWKGEISL